MFPDLFGSVDLLSRGLDAAQLRQDVIANNIANVDTPGFKASHVEFEQYMKDALESDGYYSNDGTVAEKATFGNATNAQDVEPEVVQDTDTTMRMDENNVDVEAQMIEMIKNSVYYNTLSLKVNNQLERLKLAIDGK